MNILSFLVSPVKELITYYREKKQAEHKRDLAVINHQADKAQNDHNWEMANLVDNDKALRRVSFVMFSSPIILAMAAPEHASIAFQNLNLVPSWMVETWIGINGAVWGLASLKKVVPATISSAITAWKHSK